ncbi:hypothetical protein [Actinoplanes friuliensis]|uniref:Uncharacterized protein n=1 Tax=Actinoplanes friuliensis DSM 7358 TaxID=1246995 RepID=U5VWS1_9ACTN|nr:hypothetical protein [Actinoplanes friuliensis]AGZ41242.1 hypothetical protein AFR_14800 [Actinoplanes friuliensis DSM 7358]
MIDRRKRPLLPRGERVLISEHDTAGDRQVVGTRYAVYHQGAPHEPEPWHRLGWDQIERVDRDSARGELVLVPAVPGRVPVLVLRIRDGQRFHDLARERIAATTLLRVPLSRSGRPAGALTARRRADGRGEVLWVLSCGGETPWTTGELTPVVRQACVQAGLPTTAVVPRIVHGCRTRNPLPPGDR